MAEGTINIISDSRPYCASLEGAEVKNIVCVHAYQRFIVTVGRYTLSMFMNNNGGAITVNDFFGTHGFSVEPVNNRTIKITGVTSQYTDIYSSQPFTLQ